MRSVVVLSILALGIAVAAPVHSQVANAGAATDSSRAIVERPLDATRVVAEENAASVASVTTQQSGAAVIGLRAGVHAKETARPARMAVAPSNANLGQARAMMVVGAAGLIVGGIIGGTSGTFIMVGGAVVGLFGLYDYLQ